MERGVVRRCEGVAEALLRRCEVERGGERWGTVENGGERWRTVYLLIKVGLRECVGACGAAGWSRRWCGGVAVVVGGRRAAQSFAWWLLVLVLFE